MVQGIGSQPLLERYRVEILPKLGGTYRDSIEGDQLAGEVSWELDGFLQFALLDGVEIPKELLDITEDEVRGGWDPELTERTLGWIAKHREKNTGA
ncbi:hypothetical protein [Trueperella bialowiezensis]|uniref:Uncharacterized protein n=1 Tax=Trueperella bialowiezensis TaxID=312285 RepID=A0A448PG83_9ACTO|nr:hypothetical protein [Trueperella bialowiezensis]VEI13971.1 Uncharacterised protein [Trueperella bialowiezensis]